MKIHDAVASFRENMGRLKLRTNEQSSTLVPLDISKIVDEYCEFIYALIKCRKVAEREYTKILEKIDAMSQAAETDVAGIRQGVESLPVNTDVLIDAEGDDSQAECAAILKATLDSFSRGFTETISDIRNKISQDVEELKNFKVVLFGRTKVGKSTVREALTKGDGASIGRGGQSTTIDINEYD